MSRSLATRIAAAEYWRPRVGALDEPYRLAGTSRALAATADRRVLRCVLDAAALAAIRTIGRDPLGQCTVVLATLGWTLKRYWGRPSVVLAVPPLLEDGESGAPAPLLFPGTCDHSVRTWLADISACHEAALDVGGYDDDAGRLPPFAELTDCWVRDGRIHVEVSALPAWQQATLRVLVEHMDDAGVLLFEYDAARCDSTVMEQYVAQLPQAFAMLSDRDARLAAWTPMRDVQQQDLTAWGVGDNPGADADALLVPVHERIAAVAARQPHAPALRAGTLEWSYAELERAACRVADALVDRVADDPRHGSVPPVVICMSRGPWLIAAILGVLRSGHAYLPVDPHNPTDRLAQILRDAQSPLVLTDAADAGRFAALSLDVLVVDDALPLVPASRPRRIPMTNAAYVIYTSGSTGTPKGCVLEHGQLAHYLTWATRYYWDNAPTTMALFSSVAFDMPVTTIFAPLLTGGTLVVIPETIGVDAALRWQFGSASGIDTVKLTPSHVLMLEALRIEQTSVRCAIVGGEAMTAAHLRVLQQLSAGMRVVNEYGPTEAAVGCIVDDLDAARDVTIGTPISRMDAWVLDRAGHLTPPGVRGELCVGGAGVARGYLHNPVLTAQRFVAHPFVPGARLYRTGDEARWRVDGRLESFGRLDGQVKIRGHRIELGDVEAALRAFDGVRDACAMAVPSSDGTGEYTLVAAIVGDADRPPLDASAARRALRERLPTAMVPSRVVVVGQLPLTANGKVDRKRLHEMMDVPAPVAAHAMVPLADVTERELARLYQALLNVPHVGADADFMALGGHSLRAMELLGSIHGQFGVDVGLSEIFEARTLRALAIRIRAVQPTSRIPLERTPDAPHYPLSHEQRRLWLLDQLEADRAVYNIVAPVMIDGALDQSRIRRAIDRTTRRHESLRTTIVLVDGEPRQRIADNAAVVLVDVDVSHHADPLTAAHAWIVREAATPIEVMYAPLWRVTRLVLSLTRSVLVLTQHHLITDAWSARQFVTDLLTAYDSDTAPPSLPVQYRDYVAWQQRYLRSAGAQASRAYWCTTLDGVPPVMALPTDRSRPAARTNVGARVRLDVPARSRRALEQLATTQHASPFMAWLAVVQVMLRAYAGHDAIWLGTPVAGRHDPMLNEQLGMFVNTVVLTGTVSPAQTFRERLQQAVQTAVGAFEHAAYPFDRIVDALDVPRDPSRSPLFDVLLTYDAIVPMLAPTRGVQISDIDIDVPLAKFDLTIGVREHDAGLTVEFEYNRDLFDAARMSAMLNDMLVMLDGLVAHPDRSLGEHAWFARSTAPVASPAMAIRAVSTITERDSGEAELLPMIGQLRRLWASVLQVDEIGADDDFFSLGGDSILALQVVARARAQQVPLTVRQLFTHPTLRALASTVGQLPSAPVARPVSVGDLTPIQQEFLGDGRASATLWTHYNQAVLLDLPAATSTERLGAALARVVAAHDVFGVRFVRTVDGWRQYAGHDRAVLEEAPYRDDADITAQCDFLQRTLHPEQGPLWRMVLFTPTSGGAPRLFLLAHHLVVDGVSWRILLDDLTTAWESPDTLLPDATLTMGEWSTEVVNWTRRDAIDDTDHWLGAVRAPDAWTAAWAPATDADVRQAVQTPAYERLVLDPATTTALLTTAGHAYGTDAQDILIAALLEALSVTTGHRQFTIDLEHQGRTALPLVDLSRSVGWFTVRYPIRFLLPADTDAAAVLIRTKDTIRAAPSQGLSFAALQSFAPDTSVRARLARTGASVQFNYLGQSDAALRLPGWYLSDVSTGESVDPAYPRVHALDVTALVQSGRCEVTFGYDAGRLDTHHVEQLARAFATSVNALVAHVSGPGVGAFTVSDVPACRLDAEALARVVASVPGDGSPRDRIEDIYDCTPLQEGLLYHHLRGADGDAYHEQWVFTLDGAFDAMAFRAAWDIVIARHAALRTVFRWHNVPHAVQLVLRHGHVQWTHVSHPHADEATLVDLVQVAMQQDRAQPFDLAAGPVQRVHVLQGAYGRTMVCWSHHHIVLDGWSTQLVIRDVVEVYAARQHQREPARVHGSAFRTYVQWQQERDPTALQHFWQATLGDVREPTPLPGDRREDGGAAIPATPAMIRLVRTLDADTTLQLMQAVRTQRLTASTVVRAAWALALATHARTDDVVFGVTLSGRPPDIDGIDQSVGLYIVTVPLRVQIDRGQTVGTWLRALHQQQSELDAMASLPPAMVQRCSGVSREQPLFESLVVVENYPLREASTAPEHLQVTALDVRSFTHYPLALTMIPSVTCELALDVDRHRVDEATAAAMLDDVATWLLTMAVEPATPVAAFFPAAETSFGVVPVPDALAERVAAHSGGGRRDASTTWIAAARALAEWYGSCEELHVGLAVVDTLSATALAATPVSDVSVARDNMGAVSPWDLRIVVGTIDGQFSVALASDSGRFTWPQRERAAAHLVAFADALVAQPEPSLTACAPLTDTEAAHLVAWNATSVTYAGADTLSGLVVQGLSALAMEQPDLVLVRVLSESRDWTAAAFDQRTTRLAHMLRERYAVDRNVLVGVCAERSSAMMASLVAVLKAGGAYVPLDPSLPSDRLEYQLLDSGISVLLAQRGSDAVVARLEAICATAGVAMPHIVWVTPTGDEFEAIERDASDEPLPLLVGADDLAYMIYTSGSTGRPKGALNTQGGVANRLHWMHATYPIDTRDRILQKTPYSFDVSVWELFWPFFTGARLVMAEPGSHGDSAYLARTIRAEKITTVHFVPSMLHVFVQDPLATTVAASAGGALRQLFASGEALTSAIVARAQQVLANVALHNLYGPTEAAVDVSAWTCQPGTGRSVIPIGRPIANTQLHVLDVHGRPVPPGVTGLLWIGGVQVGAGYHGRPELTSERFQSDPHTPGGRRYRTGDLARWRMDGALEYLGREDHQVKIHGHRIELGEIEAVLSSVPGIGAALVVVTQGAAGQLQLVAHIEPAPDAIPDSALVHSALAACERLLPSYMVPRAVHCWRPLPRLPNGKMDRSAVHSVPVGILPRNGALSAASVAPAAPASAMSRDAPVASTSPKSALDDAPRDTTERQLQQLWSEVLQVALVGRHDTFFELGGDSLHAVRLASRIEATFGVSVPLAAFFDHATIAQLASMIRSGGVEAAWKPLVAMSGGGKSAPLFLFPGAGGNVMAFEPLVRRLAGTRPIYGLQAVGLDGHTAPLTDVREMARVVVPAIEEAAGASPVLLVGHSFGGPLAFEVAQQLRARGTPVAWLGIFDTPAPIFDAEPITAQWTEADWIRRIASDIEIMTGITLGVDDALRTTPLADADADVAFTVLADRLTAAGWWPINAPRRALAGYLAVYRANLTTQYRAVRAEHPVPITLFTAQEQDHTTTAAAVRDVQEEPGWGWQRVMPAVTTVPVPGDHLTMLIEPQVAVLAAALHTAVTATEY